MSDDALTDLCIFVAFGFFLWVGAELDHYFMRRRDRRRRLEALERRTAIVFTPAQIELLREGIQAGHGELHCEYCGTSGRCRMCGSENGIDPRGLL
jgi:hypothetical protein